MRRWLKILLGAFAVLGIGLLSLPLWLGVVLRPAARPWGLDIGGYERVGYARFRLLDVVYVRRGVTVTAARVETDTPVLWAWRKVAGSGSATEVDRWSVVVVEQPEKKPAGQFGLVQLHALLNRIRPPLQRWLPQAVVRNGFVRWPRGGLQLAEAGWNGRALQFRGLGWQHGSADGKIAFEDDKALSIDASQGDDLRAHVRWTGADAAAEFSAWSQMLPARAHFGDHGWLPVEASAEAVNWTVPSARIGLGAQYAALHGGGRATWRDGSFQVSLQASADPLKAGGVPALTLQAEARGDREAWTVTALHLAAPFAKAELSDPVVVGFDGRVRSGPARLAFQTDLAQQPWIEARGRATGEIKLTAGMGEPVGAAFTGEAEDIAWRDVAVQHASVAGSLVWPQLELDRLEIVPDAASRATVRGGYDFKTKTIDDAKAEGHLTQAWLQRWLPAEAVVTGVEFNATAKGPLTDLEHAGEVRAATVQFPPLKSIGARATWQGRGKVVENADLHLVAGATTLDLAGAVQQDRASLKSLRFAPGGKEVWLLAAPATIEWRPALRIDGLRLQGPVSHVSVDGSGGEAGTVKVEIGQLNAEWWRDLVDLPGPNWQIRQLTFTGGLSEGKLKFAITAEGGIELLPQSAKVSLAATGDGDGVRLTELKIVDADRVLAQAQGRLPVTWDERARPHFRIDPDAPLELQATTEPSSPLWTALAKSFGLVLDGPMARVQLSGTVRRPVGELHVAIERLALEAGKFKFPLPAVEKLTLVAKADRDGLTLDDLAANLDGQPLHASGHVPLDDARWRQLWDDRKHFDWRSAEGRIDLAEADLALLARYAPNYLATQGKLEVHAAFKGGNLSGELKLRDAATRPLPALGIVQEIAADVALNGRTLNIRSFAGKLGGQPVALQGSIELPAGAAPRYALTLKAEDVPLVRRGGVLVRSDLDLRTESDATGITRISGVVNVTDGLLLSDLRALLPSGEKGVARPPPYFVIETPPFDRWPLAVEVHASHTVRIRTALFNGTASGRFSLDGTLGNPRAIGEISIDKGEVIFPFVTFTVQLGTVRLTAADPYHPQLNVNAIARRDNYDLRMEATGPAEAPLLKFSANPALISEQVLLMVMAGQAPTEDLTSSNGSQRLTRIGAYFGQSLIQGLGGGDRLEITSGERVSDKGHETYELEYKLNDRWSAVSEYDEYDQFNAGLKWRIYTDAAKYEAK